MNGGRDEARHGAPRLAGDAEASRTRIVEAARAELERQLSRPSIPGLTLVATPIGNLGDMTLRAIATLATADLILCEDTRVSRTLLAHFGIRRPLRAFHDHNEASETAKVLTEIAQGRGVALISDAGMPLVSDPGYILVRAVAAAGHRVSVVPGPSAPLAALAVSGLPSDTFHFAGFLPARSSSRRARLRELAAIPATLVLLETAVRLVETLRDLAEVLGARETVIARELTKRYEEIRRGRPDALAESIAAASIKGEIVLLVAPSSPTAVDDARIEAELSEALAHASLRDAVKTVATALAVPRARVYALALRLKGGEA